MLSEERHQIIIDLLNANGAITVADLVARFDVSEMTVRRDLKVLERQGHLQRVHGGAVSSRGRSYEPPFLTRSGKNQSQKERIGKLAASLVNNGDSIALDVGTTTLEFCRYLEVKNNLTIITPSFRAASHLAEQPGIRVILTGGILRPGELSMVGYLVECTFREFFVDKLFLGIGGIDLEAGLTEFNSEDALVKKAMLRSAKEVIVVADASKVGQIAFAAVAPLDVVDILITDDSLSPAVQSKLEDLNIQVLIT